MLLLYFTISYVQNCECSAQQIWPLPCTWTNFLFNFTRISQSKMCIKISHTLADKLDLLWIRTSLAEVTQREYNIIYVLLMIDLPVSRSKLTNKTDFHLCLLSVLFWQPLLPNIWLFLFAEFGTYLTDPIIPFSPLGFLSWIKYRPTCETKDCK